MSAAMCNARTGTGSGRTLESLGEDKASVLFATGEFYLCNSAAETITDATEIVASTNRHSIFDVMLCTTQNEQTNKQTNSDRAAKAETAAAAAV
jgi:hypothetical protein